MGDEDEMKVGRIKAKGSEGSERRRWKRLKAKGGGFKTKEGEPNEGRRIKNQQKVFLNIFWVNLSIFNGSILQQKTKVNIVDCSDVQAVRIRV
jgi:hypothetical protein